MVASRGIPREADIRFEEAVAERQAARTSLLCDGWGRDDQRQKNAGGCHSDMRGWDVYTITRAHHILSPATHRNTLAEWHVIYHVNRLALLSLVIASALGAQTDTARLRGVPNPRVTSGGWVADPANHLSTRTRAQVDSIASALERETTAEIAVAVVDSLEGLEPADAALLFHRRWGVGKRERDNGIVLLWSPARRQIFVSVGYGLEGVLPDARTGRIQDREMLPAFRRGDFDAGVIAGVTALAAAAREETYSGLTRAVAGQPVPGQSRRNPWSWIVGSLLALAGIGSAIVFAVTRPKRCPKGHGPMKRLAEAADNAHLDKGQSLEESIGSIDYDVWTCVQCDTVRVIPRQKWFSGYENCPNCERRTVKRSSRQVVAPTYASAGKREVSLKCRNCGYARQYDEKIPMLTRSTSSGGGGGRGGFGGGSSFGGGSAGGAGAGRSY